MNKTNYVFLGDSIFANFTQLSTLKNSKNLAIPGNKLVNLFSDLIPLKRLSPKCVYILIGINDYLLKKSMFDITMDVLFEKSFELFLDMFKTNFPNSKLYVLSILPMVDRLNPAKTLDFNNEIAFINQNILKYVNRFNYTFINVSEAFISNGSPIKTFYTQDGIHLNVKGYAVLHAILKEHMGESL